MTGATFSSICFHFYFSEIRKEKNIRTRTSTRNDTDLSDMYGSKTVFVSPGGGKIISSVLETIVNIIDYGFVLRTAIELPRFHHQWYPDVLQVEENMMLKMNYRELKNMGYDIKQVPEFGRIDAIMFLPNGSMTGYSDSRGYGKAIGY